MGRTDLCVVVLPSVDFYLSARLVFFISCRGDYTGEEMYNFTLVLPSVFLCLILLLCVILFQMTGRFTGEVDY